MIEHLLINLSSYFFLRTKEFTAAAIEDLFAALPDMVDNPGACLIREIRKAQNGAIYSAICFPFDRVPPFFSKTAGLVDRVHGYMLIVENGDLVAIQKSGLEIIPEFKDEWLERVSSDAVQRAIATVDAKFELMGLRSMSTSKQALRVKTLEADDLENAMPMASASRYVGKRFRLRKQGIRFTATPMTGRIAQNADRSGYTAIVDWSIEIMQQLAQSGGEVAPFIANFARPVDLTSLVASVAPTNFAVDVAELADRLFAEQPVIKLTRKKGPKDFSPLTIAECRDVLRALDRELSIDGPRDGLKIIDPVNPRQIGSLKWGKSRIGLSTYHTAETERIYVVPADQEKAPDQQIALKAYLDREDLFLLLFDDVSVAYVNGELFQDNAMRDGGASFLSHLKPHACLRNATSEKGSFKSNQKRFSANSVFGQLHTTIAFNDDVLICDDLGDEWADFIGLDTKGTPPMITFYHAKHGKVSLGASAFHESVGQAEKNLGRLNLPVHELDAKFDSWEKKPYENSKTVTAIPRLLRGGPRSEIERHLTTLRNSPEVVRRVSIVTSSLSYQSVEDAFASIKAGKRPTAHFVQLFWLLSSFFSTCAEMGAVGYVICQP